MELRHGELMRLQEKLMGDLEKALNRREVRKGRGGLAQCQSLQRPTTGHTPALTNGLNLFSQRHVSHSPFPVTPNINPDVTPLYPLKSPLVTPQVLGVKGRATQIRSKTVQDATVTRMQQEKAVAELARSVKDTEREVAVTDARLRELGGQRGEMQVRAEGLRSNVALSGSSRWHLPGRSIPLHANPPFPLNLNVATIFLKCWHRFHIQPLA